ncbi:hypothetical protein [Streptomyces sp. NPDC048551]|uniref:hypothetical protein n=1 Tax=Streptomyces sp. NPDC048551 TaxID=3155758 RepID=UPI0034123AA6
MHRAHDHAVRQGGEPEVGVNAVNAEPAPTPTPRITISTQSPETIADALTAHLTPDDLKAVTELLMTRI